jgi:hypothetical protein
MNLFVLMIRLLLVVQTWYLGYGYSLEWVFKGRHRIPRK